MAAPRRPDWPLGNYDQPPLIADIEAWLNKYRGRVATKSPLGEALNYIAKYWAGLCQFLDDGRIELDNNSVERTIRPIALNRKNALFAGHDAGAQNWAIIASLIETCKLNGVEPHTYLTNALKAIAGGHKQSQIDALSRGTITSRCEQNTAYCAPGVHIRTYDTTGGLDFNHTGYGFRMAWPCRYFTINRLNQKW